MSTIHARVMDGRIAAFRETDQLLTTSARLTAEPNDPLPLGSLGVAYSGEFLGGKMPQQVELRGLMVKVATTPSLLTASERASIAAIVARFSGRSAGPVSAAGVVSNDTAATTTTHWAAESAAQVKAGVDRVADIQRRNDDFWERQNKAMHADVG